MTFNSDNSRSTDEMGKLLLSGWIMLQDSCPNCNYPLFSKAKDRSVLKCVNCGILNDNKERSIEDSNLKKEIKPIETAKLSTFEGIDEKIESLVKDLNSTKTDSFNIDHQIKLSTLILNCLQIKSFK